MSYEPPGFTRKPIYAHEKLYESSSKVPSTLYGSEKPAVNGIANYGSRPEDGNQRRNYKLLIDPVIKKGHQKIYRFDGEFPGQAPITLKDPRPRRTRIWALNKADLPVPNFKVDKNYVGIPPQREVVFSGLNDNVDRKFLQEMCQKYGRVENIKIYYDPQTKKHTGKAKVTFDTTKTAKLACTHLDCQSVMGNIIKTQLEPNIKGLGGHLKHQRSFSHPSTKGAAVHDDSIIVRRGKSYLPPSKQFVRYPTPPPSINSHSPSMESNLSTPNTTQTNLPVDPRIKNAFPVTPPPPESTASNSGSTDRSSFSSHLLLSSHGSLFSSTRSVSSINSFEPISPPPVPHRDQGLPPPPPPPVNSDVKGALAMPLPENKTASFLNYEDISPEPVFSPVDETAKKISQPVAVMSQTASSKPAKPCDESKISKLIESYRRDSTKCTPPRDQSRSPKGDRHNRDDHRSHEQRHHDRDDRRDKHREKHGEYRSRDYHDDKDYVTRWENKRVDKHSEIHRSIYRHHDSRRDSSFYGDYKSRKGDYGRSLHRDDDRSRRGDCYREESKYKRSNDRYTTSPRRAEERDKYAMSPRRSDERKKTDSDLYGKDVKDSYHSRERHAGARKSPTKEMKEEKITSYSATTCMLEENHTCIAKTSISNAEITINCDSLSSSESRTKDISLPDTTDVSSCKENMVDIISFVVSGTPTTEPKVDLYNEDAYTIGVEACSDEEPLPPGDEPCVSHKVQLDRARTKLKVAQDLVRKRKLSTSLDDKQESGNKSKKIQIVLKSNQLTLAETEESSTKVKALSISQEKTDDERGVWKSIEPAVEPADDQGSNTLGGNSPVDSKPTDLPQFEDISPCPSPLGTVAINAVVRSSEEQSNLYSDIEANDDVDIDATTDNNNANESNDDDAMSLSSISSNEDTFEVNEPVKNIQPQHKPVIVPLPSMVFPFPPPPIIPIPLPVPFNPHVPPPMLGPVTVPPPPLALQAVIPPLPQPTIPPALVPSLPPPIPPPSVHQAPGRLVKHHASQQSAASYANTYQPRRGGYSSSGFMPNFNRSEQLSKTWYWKHQVIDAVSSRVHSELKSILNRDVFRKLVEASAFKSLEAWWDNQTKPKTLPAALSSSSHYEQTTTSTIGQPSSSSATPMLGPSPFDRSHSMALGLRASLPKLPTFKRRIQEAVKDDKMSDHEEKLKVKQSLVFLNQAPKRRRLNDSEAESEHDAEIEASSREGERRRRTISRLEDEGDDDRSQSPWHLEDSMDAAPPAMSVRSSQGPDRRASTGASLYKTVYSSDDESDEKEEESESESESESEESEEESEEEEDSDEESEYEESDEEKLATEEEDIRREAIAGKILEKGLQEDKESVTSEISVGSLREVFTDEALSEDREGDEPIKSRVETTTLSQTTSYHPADTPSWDFTAKEEKEEREEKVEEEGGVEMEIAVHEEESSDENKEEPEDAITETLVKLNKGITQDSKVEVNFDTQESSSSNEELFDTSKAPLTVDIDRSVTQSDEDSESLFSPGGQSIVSIIELDHTYGIVSRDESPTIDIITVGKERLSPVPPLVPVQKTEQDEEHKEYQEIKEVEPIQPEIPKPVFSVRSFEADDELVYEFLKAGIDYEDAHYLKIGFDRLVQVGSESVIGAKWSFHTVTAQPSLNPSTTKRRRQKLELGLHPHPTGSARSEGYYKIDTKEKAKNAEHARRQVQHDIVPAKEEQMVKLDASKGKQQSRENRAMQRRLQSAVCNEDFGDILKFNKLRVRKKQLRFAKSSIHDWGLFALEPIAADEMVIEYVGEVIRQAIADYREGCYEKRGIGSSYMFRLDEDTIIDATINGNLARFINHCCDPNCYAKVIAVENQKKIVIYSKRDIQVDEEITYDYKFPLEDEKIPCLCDAPQCRGTLN